MNLSEKKSSPKGEKVDWIKISFVTLIVVGMFYAFKVSSDHLRSENIEKLEAMKAEINPIKKEFCLGTLMQISDTARAINFEDHMNDTDKSAYYSFQVKDSNKIIRVIDVRIVDIELVDDSLYKAYLVSVGDSGIPKDPYRYIRENMWGRRLPSGETWKTANKLYKVRLYVPLKTGRSHINCWIYERRE